MAATLFVGAAGAATEVGVRFGYEGRGVSGWLRPEAKGGLNGLLGNRNTLAPQ